jgi:formate dehydrogenase (NADP+) alpha subunit
VAGLAISFGSGAMTNSINEIPDSKVMFVIGSNTTEAHPIIGAKMRQAVRKGATLIVADPRAIELTQDANLWLRHRPGTDVALINGLLHIILKEGWENKEFVESRTEGFEDLAKLVETYTPEKVAQITGVAVEKLYEAAKLYATAESAQIFYTLGITEHTCGTDNVMSLANLAMLTGNVGKENSGVNPLRGQNNVQGACDMGALPNVFPGYQKVGDPAVQAKFEQAWGVKLDDKLGFMIPDMFDAGVNGTLKAMYVFGEDPVITDADANHVRKGLNSLEFMVVQELFMSETAKLADVILPGASFAEKDGTFTNTERRVQRVRKAVEPIGNTKPDWQIIMEVAKRMGGNFNYADPSEIFDEVASLTSQYAGINYDRLEHGIQWPCPDKNHPGTKFLHQGQFTSGLGKFQAIEFAPAAELPDEEFPILLTTGRMLYHYGTMTRNSKGLNNHVPEELAEVNAEDLAKLGVEDGGTIFMESRRGKLSTKVKVTDRVPPGVIFMTHHFFETPVNELTNGAYDKVTKTYEYKVCAVRISKAQ